MTTGKTLALSRQTSVGKVMSLLLNMLSRLVITFLPRSKRLLISWLPSPSAVILEPWKIKSATVSTVSHLFAVKWWDQMPWSSFSECWDLSQLFHSPLSLSSRGSLVLLHFLPWNEPVDFTGRANLGKRTKASKFRVRNSPSIDLCRTLSYPQTFNT